MGSMQLTNKSTRYHQKNEIEDLAYFGGNQLFSNPKPIGQLSHPDREMFFKFARNMFENRRCTNNGPLVRELEKRLANLHQTKHCIAFANACLGIVSVLHLLAPSAGEIIMPAFTYVGLPHLAQWAGHTPKYCEVDPCLHTIDPVSVENSITESVVLILAVQQANSTCDINKLTEIANYYEIPLVFDSVHGAGNSFKGTPLGGFGCAEIFSLHATKLINGFEGGYVTTDDYILAEKLRNIRNFGFAGRDSIIALGMNAKLNEIHAAMALTVLDRFGEIIQLNRKRYKNYLYFLKGIEGIRLLEYERTERYNYSLSLVEIDDTWELSRDQVVELLRSENALAQPYYSPPLHLSIHHPKNLEIPYLPITEGLSKRFIQLPMGEMIDKRDIEQIAELIFFIRDNQHLIAQKYTQERNNEIQTI